MIGSIFSILVDIGLLSADWKHYNRIKKQEKKDGIKRPFRKYLLQPTMVGFYIVLIITSLLYFLGLIHGQSRYTTQTESEMVTIETALDEWKEVYGTFPALLQELTQSRPLRIEWLTDKWNRPYNYSIKDNGQKFQLISAGSDGIFGNKDDLRKEK